MKKLLILALLIFAGYTAWQRAPAFFKRPALHEAVVINQSRKDIIRVRVIVGDQTFVKESLPSGEDVTFTFRVNKEEPLSLEFVWKETDASDRWRGGKVTQGPIAQRHKLTIMDRNSVIHQVERRTITG